MDEYAQLSKATRTHFLDPEKILLARAITSFNQNCDWLWRLIWQRLVQRHAISARFLPERHTDFIFAVLSEEFGLVGVLLLLSLYLFVILRGLYIASQAQETFGRLLAGSLILVFFVYLFVNTGMVSGLLPVVGVPLPLVSYGEPPW